MHAVSSEKGAAAWAALPIFASAHDYEDFMLVME
jgi:hypothetical protein